MMNQRPSIQHIISWMTERRSRFFWGSVTLLTCGSATTGIDMVDDLLGNDMLMALNSFNIVTGLYLLYPCITTVFHRHKLHTLGSYTEGTITDIGFAGKSHVIIRYRFQSKDGGIIDGQQALYRKEAKHYASKGIGATIPVFYIQYDEKVNCIASSKQEYSDYEAG